MEPVENTSVDTYFSSDIALSPLFYSQGDSIQNILGDLVSCALGYVLGTVFAAVEFWWISLIWIVASEV